MRCRQTLHHQSKLKVSEMIEKKPILLTLAVNVGEVSNGSDTELPMHERKGLVQRYLPGLMNQIFQKKWYEKRRGYEIAGHGRGGLSCRHWWLGIWRYQELKTGITARHPVNVWSHDAGEQASLQGLLRLLSMKYFKNAGQVMRMPRRNNRASPSA